jgi:hypothetical protein
MRPLEMSDVRLVAGYLAEALMAECGSRVRPSELEQSLNLEIDSTPPHSPRFWLVERLGTPMVIASGPSRDKRSEGFDYVVWLSPSSPPLKEARLRFWLEKWAPTEPCRVATFCRAHGILPASISTNAR